MFDFIELKTLYVIGHIFGAIIGAGGAFTSDAMFFSTIRDGKINKDELRFMKLGSKLVWLGFIILVISGILLITTDPDKYLNSSKLLVKITIVAIIFVNGLIFHLIHIPHIEKHMGLKLISSKSFMKRASFIMISGAISMTSWVSTVVLGTLRSVPYTYIEILSFYILLVIISMIGALSMKKAYLVYKEIK
jgi:hypothetical protein